MNLSSFTTALAPGFGHEMSSSEDEAPDAADDSTSPSCITERPRSRGMGILLPSLVSRLISCRTKVEINFSGYRWCSVNLLRVNPRTGTALFEADKSRIPVRVVAAARGFEYSIHETHRAAHFLSSTLFGSKASKGREDEGSGEENGNSDHNSKIS